MSLSNIEKIVRAFLSQSDQCPFCYSELKEKVETKYFKGQYESSNIDLIYNCGLHFKIFNYEKEESNTSIHAKDPCKKLDKAIEIKIQKQLKNASNINS